MAKKKKPSGPTYFTCQECLKKFSAEHSYFKGLIYCDSCLRKLVIKAAQALVNDKEDSSDLPNVTEKPLAPTQQLEGWIGNE